MKRKLLILKIFSVLILVFLIAGCGKNGAQEDVDPEVPEEVAEFDKSFLRGPTLGSSKSDLVVNREVWRDFPGQLKNRLAEETSVHVPRFLLDSQDSHAANEELDGIVAEILDIAQYFQGDMSEEELRQNVYSTYSVYQDDKILSVFMEYHYYLDFRGCSFNFRLSDGKRLSDKELAAIYGVESFVLGMMESGLAAEYQKDIDADLREGYGISFESPGFIEGMALENLWENYSPEGHRLYVNESGQLSFFFTKPNPGGAGDYVATSPLEQVLPFRDKEISPSYIRMAHALGRDPYKDTSPAYVLHLGGMYDEWSVKSVLMRFESWAEDYNSSEDIRVLPRLSTDSWSPAGSEAYIVVPKWENSVIHLEYLELSDEGEVKKITRDPDEIMKVRGSSLIWINISDIFPNSEVVIRYRDERIAFTPHISLMDGAVVLPEEIVNAEDLLVPWIAVTEDNDGGLAFSYFMYEQIMSLISEEED